MPLIESSGRTKRALGAATIVMCAGLLAPAMAQAEVSACTNQFVTFGSWSPPTLTLENGYVVSSMNVTSHLDFTITGSDELWSVGGFQQGDWDSTHHAIGIGFGLGLRIVHAGTSVSTTPQHAVGPEKSAGVPGDAIARGFTIIKKMEIPRVPSSVKFRIAQTWKYELVIINKDAYTNGNLRGVILSNTLGAAFLSSPPANTNDKCQGLTGQVPVFSGSLAGRPDPPVLPPPPPPVPTPCNFGTQNQTVNLQPAHHDNVAASDAARSAGTEGQASFSIVGTGCGNGTSFKLYFSDATNAANTSKILSLATSSINRDRLGIRLFHDNRTTAVDFGRVPTSSNQANGIEIKPSGGTVTVPFTAQYVRYPTVLNPRDLEVGPIRAAATLTILNN